MGRNSSRLDTQAIGIANAGNAVERVALAFYSLFTYAVLPIVLLEGGSTHMQQRVARQGFLTHPLIWYS